MTQKTIAPNIPSRVTTTSIQKARPRNVAQYRSHDEEVTLARARFASMQAAQSAKEAPREAPQKAPQEASPVTPVEPGTPIAPIVPTGTDTATAQKAEPQAPKATPKRSHKKKTVRTDDLALAAPAPTQEDKATVERLFQSPWGAQPKSRSETLDANEAAREELAATLARFEEAHKKEAKAQEPQKVGPFDKVDLGREETSPVARPFENFEDSETVERPAPADAAPSVDRGASPKSAKAPASTKAPKVTKTPKSSKTAAPKKKAKTAAVSTASAVDATDTSTTTAPSLEDVAALEDFEGFDLDVDPAATVTTHPSTQRLLGSTRADATSTRQALSKALNSAAKDVEAPKEVPAQEDAATPMFTRLRERRTALPPENTSAVFDDLNTPELDAALDEIGTTGNFSGGSQAFFALCERAIRARAEAREAAQKDVERSEFADDPQAEAAPLEGAYSAAPGASDTSAMDAPAGPSQAEFEYLQKDGEALFMRDNFEASRTTDRLTGRIRPNESREDRAQDLVKIAAEIDDVVARTRAAAQKDATDPRLCEATWVAGGLISDYIALLELERRTAAEEAEKLAREGVAVFLELPGIEPEPLTPTQAWSAALNKRQSAAEDDVAAEGARSSQAAQAVHTSPAQKYPLPSGNATPTSAEALLPTSPQGSVAPSTAQADVPADAAIPAEGVQGLRASNTSNASNVLNASNVWRAMLSGVAGALLVAGCAALWEAYSPSPVLVTADRERLREETALLRLAHTRPGMPERADLRGLDAHAIDQAIAAAHSASAGADLPLVDTNLLLQPSAKVLDITNDVRLRLGIRPSDLATLEAAVREGWSAAPAFTPEASPTEAPRTAPAATTPEKTNTTKTSAQPSTKTSPKTTAQAAVAEGATPKPGTSGNTALRSLPNNTKGTQLLEAASYAEAHPEAEGQDLDFSSRVRRVVARLRGFSEEVFR